MGRCGPGRTARGETGRCCRCCCRCRCFYCCCYPSACTPGRSCTVDDVDDERSCSPSWQSQRRAEGRRQRERRARRGTPGVAACSCAHAGCAGHRRPVTVWGDCLCTTSFAACRRGCRDAAACTRTRCQPCGGGRWRCGRVRAVARRPSTAASGAFTRRVRALRPARTAPCRSRRRRQPVPHAWWQHRRPAWCRRAAQAAAQRVVPPEDVRGWQSRRGRGAWPVGRLLGWCWLGQQPRHRRRPPKRPAWVRVPRVAGSAGTHRCWRW